MDVDIPISCGPVNSCFIQNYKVHVLKIRKMPNVRGFIDSLFEGVFQQVCNELKNFRESGMDKAADNLLERIKQDIRLDVIEKRGALTPKEFLGKRVASLSAFLFCYFA